MYTLDFYTLIWLYEVEFSQKLLFLLFMDLWCSITIWVLKKFFFFLMQMFQKGSPVARDVSKAILNLSEKAELKRLEEKWLITSQDCSNNVTSSNNMESLKLGSLWVLYVISGATSTICLLISTFQCLKSNQQHGEEVPLELEGNNNGTQ